MDEKLIKIIVKNNKGVFLLQNITKELKETIIEKVGPNIVIYFYLFGSYARNEQTNDSDLDICLVYDETKISELNINLIVDEISENLLDRYGIIINVLCFTDTFYIKNEKTSKLFNNIKREGIHLGG